MGSLPYRGGRLHRRRGLHFCLLLCSEITETLKLTRVSNVQCMRANPVYRLIKFCESLEGLFLSRNYGTCLLSLKATPSHTKKKCLFCFMDTGGPCCMLRSCRDCFDIQTEKDVEEFKAQSQPLQALGLQNAINLTNSTHKKKQNIGR